MKATIPVTAEARKNFTVTYQWMERGEPRTGRTLVTATSSEEAARKFRRNYPHVNLVGVAG